MKYYLIHIETGKAFFKRKPDLFAVDNILILFGAVLVNTAFTPLHYLFFIAELEILPGLTLFLFGLIFLFIGLQLKFSVRQFFPSFLELIDQKASLIYYQKHQQQISGALPYEDLKGFASIRQSAGLTSGSTTHPSGALNLR